MPAEGGAFRFMGIALKPIGLVGGLRATIAGAVFAMLFWAVTGKTPLAEPAIFMGPLLGCLCVEAGIDPRRNWRALLLIGLTGGLVFGLIGALFS